MTGLWGCRPAPASLPSPADAPLAVDRSLAATPAASEGDAIASTPAEPVLDGRAVVLIDEPEALARLAADLDLGRMLFDVPGGTTKELRRSARYRSLVYGVILERTPRSEGEFPQWWLGHPRTSFVLVGVTNRLDRRDLRPGTCGETRLVHRLSYRLDGVLRYLPMTINVVLDQPDDGESCRSVAASWVVPEGEDPIDRLTAAGGPLHPDRLGLDRLHVVETNVRLEDDDHEENGEPGRGLNELRGFVLDAQGRELEPARLENQPWGKYLLVRRDVAAWLRTPGVLESIERGTATILERWQWDVAHLVVGHDDDQSFEFEAMWERPGVLEQISLPAEGVTSTRDGLTHRLIGMSCEGCHAARSVAGFHLPGAGDRLRGGASAHLRSELPWRVAYVEAVAQGREPVVERKLPNDGPPGFGRSCSRPGSPVATLRCDAGFSCIEAPGFRFGTCLPDGYQGPAPCERGEPLCRAPSPWFPAGFTARPCDEGQPCAVVPTPADARKCRWATDPWACAFERATPTMVDRCAAQSDCRSGYACVEREGEGSCLPVAVVPELRVLGHRARLR